MQIPTEVDLDAEDLIKALESELTISQIYERWSLNDEKSDLKTELYDEKVNNEDVYQLINDLCERFNVDTVIDELIDIIDESTDDQIDRILAIFGIEKIANWLLGNRTSSD